jgi:hypothetical protein
MTRQIIVLLASAAVLAACGKKEPAAPANQNAAPAKTSLESLVTPQESVPPAPPAATAPETSPTEATTAEPSAEGNWFSRKTVAEKTEIMEGWLYNYHNSDPATKAAIMKQMQEAKLSAADKTMLNKLGAQLKYPPIQFK